MSTIQTVIDQYEEAGCDDTYHEVFFLEEPPEVVKASAELQVTVGKYHTITRTVYSLEEYMKEQTRPLSDFCPPAKKGIWWLTIKTDIWEMLFDNAFFSNAHDYSKGKLLVNHLHVTLAYDVSESERPCKFDSHLIEVKGLAYNDKCACLVVSFLTSGVECCNARPHITLATAGGVPPVYSNQMLAGVDGAYHFLPLEAELEGTLEFLQFQ